MTMTTLYLVRHGETVDNARQIMQGQTQGELNATGISQAEALRDKLIPSLADREWPANVESAERLLARARNFLTWVRVTYPDQVVVAVGHGIINKAIQSVYHQRPMSQIMKMTNAEMRVLML